MKKLTTQKNIPSGWQSIFVGDICYVMKGQGLSKKDIDPSGKNKCLLYGELFTTYGEVIENIKSRTNSTIGIPSVNGDILMPGSTTTVARDLAVASALNEDGVLLGGDINILRKKDGAYDSNFLAYYLTHYKKDEIGKLGQGSTIVHLYGSNIKDLEVVIPKNIKEQKKIAEILGTVDEDIAKTQELIKATEKLKRGLMQQLFTCGIGHSKFKETKTGQIPEEWDVLELGKVCDVRDGTHSSPKYHEEGYPLITSKNLVDNGLDFDNVSLISETDFREIERRSGVDDGDILFGMIGTIGNPVIVQKYRDFAIKNVALIKFNKSEMNNVFVLNFLKSTHTEKQFNQKKGGSTQKFIALGLIRQILITVPSQREQKEIAEILSTVDQKILANKKLKEKLTLLKKGMMQDLLSGKVRTNI